MNSLRWKNRLFTLGEAFGGRGAGQKRSAKESEPLDEAAEVLYRRRREDGVVEVALAVGEIVRPIGALHWMADDGTTAERRRSSV